MMITLLFSLVLTSGPGDYEPGKVSTIKIGKVHYAIRVPKKLDKKKGAPAIVFLHGSNMRGKNYVGSLNTIRTLKSWVLIGPTGPKKVNERQYNHGPGDERYVKLVIEDIEKRLKIKLTRIYVGGHSQGGFLCHAVAAHMPDRIDGVIAVSGGSWVNPRKLSRKRKGGKLPIPVAIVHAQNDPVVSFRVSVGVYDAYVKAGHMDVRLFAPTRGAHMFLHLPIISAIEWLDLMNASKLSQVNAVLGKLKPGKDPRTAWDAMHVRKRLSKNKKRKADKARLKKIAAEGKKRAGDLGKRLKKAKGKQDKALLEECWLFLADYGMVEARGSWRKDLKKALRK